MTTEEISEILKLHKAWINGEKHGKRADLSGADLSGANLSGADLSRAYLYGANLSGADLSRAYLSGAYLSGANLSGANLYGAYLSRAYLYGANLSGADLSRAYLSGAYLSGAENVPYTPMACPDEGEFTGWKKCKSDRIVKLKIPEYARRSSASRRKCRCDKAEVIEITSIDGKEKYTEAVSGRDADFVYKVGEMVSVDDFCENRWEECAAGIHFFMNRKEAVDYLL